MVLVLIILHSTHTTVSFSLPLTQFEEIILPSFLNHTTIGTVSSPQRLGKASSTRSLVSLLSLWETENCMSMPERNFVSTKSENCSPGVNRQATAWVLPEAPKRLISCYMNCLPCLILYSYQHLFICFGYLYNNSSSLDYFLAPLSFLLTLTSSLFSELKGLAYLQLQLPRSSSWNPPLRLKAFEAGSRI